MPTRDQQAHAFRQRPVVVDVGGQVPAQVVDAVERDVPAGGVRLGGGHPDQQCPGQPRSDGRGDDVGALDARGVQGAAHGRPQGFQVRTRGDLGDDAAVAGVLVDAGGDFVGQKRNGHSATVVNGEVGDADSGFVTRAFDGQDDHVGPPWGRRCMVYASAPLAW